MESVRVEFKAGWDPKTTGPQVLKTICAFANDLQGLNGGYIVLGVQEAAGRAALPAAGLTPDQLAAAQKWIRGNCNRIDPVYQPVMSPEVVGESHILVVWVPPSDTRPHSAAGGPKQVRKYWVRLGAETVDAQANGMLDPLLETTARVPWDDRRALQARVEDLRIEMVREHLHDVPGSKSYSSPPIAPAKSRRRASSKEPLLLSSAPASTTWRGFPRLISRRSATGFGLGAG